MRRWSRKKVAVVGLGIISALGILWGGVIITLILTETRAPFVFAVIWVVMLAAGLHLTFFCREIAQFYEELYLSPRGARIAEPLWDKLWFKPWFYAFFGVGIVVISVSMLIEIFRH
jgi:hypothetical protein